MFGSTREEYHIYQHIKRDFDREAWGATGRFFAGASARSLAIKEAKRLQEEASPGVEYSVQIHLFGINGNHRPCKIKIWRNGIEYEIPKDKFQSQSNSFSRTKEETTPKNSLELAYR
ncbi:hypothetical protein [Leptospira licerasiae]|uniref:hypothetical protein n=1 Tax=Leptospira licerasiae TaxID=447106 RepID=UPI0002488325|nr:hypothetical protein [Leptospira licerasiae]EIE01455.1 hypothetical protein LEP1GSC185_3908 [Leptospira licerasiae serovar Varillal str. VAR 010]